MSIELTAPQQQALTERHEFPPRVIDSRTGEACVLLHAEMYERVRALLEEEDEIAFVRETYGVVTEVLDGGEAESSSKEIA